MSAGPSTSSGNAPQTTFAGGQATRPVVQYPALQLTPINATPTLPVPNAVSPTQNMVSNLQLPSLLPQQFSLPGYGFMSAESSTPDRSTRFK